MPSQFPESLKLPGSFGSLERLEVFGSLDRLDRLGAFGSLGRLDHLGAFGSLERLALDHPRRSPDDEFSIEKPFSFTPCHEGVLPAFISERNLYLPDVL